MAERNLVNITITMTKEERKALKLMALEEDISVSALLRKWLQEKLELEKAGLEKIVAQKQDELISIGSNIDSIANSISVTQAEIDEYKNRIKSTKNVILDMSPSYFEELIKFYKSAPPGFFDEEFETFLICMKVSAYLKKGYLDELTGALFEEASLNALCQTFFTSISVVDLRLLIDELPRILTLPYKAVDSLFVGTHSTFTQFLQYFRTNGEMEKFEELTYLMRMIQTLAAYRSVLNERSK